MWLLYFSLIIFSHCSHCSCIVVITSETNEMPQPDAHFVIPDFNDTLSGLYNFTMCGRFKIYQYRVLNTSMQDGMNENITYLDYAQEIFPGFGTFSFESCRNDEPNCLKEMNQRFGYNIKLKQVYQYTYYTFDWGWSHFYPNGRFFNVIPTLIVPDKWNSFCLNSTSHYMKLNNHRTWVNTFNGRFMENFVFMNTMTIDNDLGLRLPMYGAFTDVNVWNRTLTEEEEDKWMNCDQIEGGNIINWQNISQNINPIGLKKVNDSKENICPKRYENLLISNDSRIFDEAFKYCNRLGDMAAVVNNETALDFQKAQAASIYAVSSWVFSGFTNQSGNNEWVIHGTDEKLTWNHWSENEPRKNKHCSLFNDIRVELFSAHCRYGYYQACNMAEVKIYMRGF